MDEALGFGANQMQELAMTNTAVAVTLTMNFENLFNTFPGVVHTEIGALMLYTMLQASPIFTTSLAVRSDLDILIVPLLRTLYFSTSTSHVWKDYYHYKTKRQHRSLSSSSLATVDVWEQPFRSQSQLYVILILLLVFSQDRCFGPDIFG